MEDRKAYTHPYTLGIPNNDRKFEREELNPVPSRERVCEPNASLQKVTMLELDLFLALEGDGESKSSNASSNAEAVGHGT